MEENLSLTDLQRIGIGQSKLNELFNRNQRDIKSNIQTRRISIYAKKRYKFCKYRK